MAIAFLVVAVLVLTTASAIIEALGLQLDAGGQRLVKIVAGVVAGATFFITLHELVAKYGKAWHPRTRKLFVLSITAAASTLVIILAMFNDPYLNLRHMTGTQDIAALAFVRRDGSRTQPLKDLTAELAERLANQLPATTVEPYVDVDAPLHRLLETGNPGIDDWTAEFAERSGADLIFGGVIDDESDLQIRIRPAIYVSPALVPEAMELSGWTLGPWMPAIGGLASSRGRESVLSAFLHDGSSIANFLDALDAWRIGDVVVADHLLRTIPTDNGQGLFPVEMLYLFRGHARQLVALNTNVDNRRRSELLASAAEDYRHIPASSPIAVRAQLSLATNEYHRSSGRECSPTKVNHEGLEHASTEMGRIANRTGIRPTVRLAALINFAQTMACMRRAQEPIDEAKLSGALTDIRAFDTSDSNLRSLVSGAQALGRAIEAEQASVAGREDEALELIHQAIDLSIDPRERGTWWGFASVWEAQRCNDIAARSSLQEATEQYRLAVSAGRMAQGSLDLFLDRATTELNQEQTRCTN